MSKRRRPKKRAGSPTLRVVSRRSDAELAANAERERRSTQTRILIAGLIGVGVLISIPFLCNDDMKEDKPIDRTGVTTESADPKVIDVKRTDQTKKLKTEDLLDSGNDDYNTMPVNPDGTPGGPFDDLLIQALSNQPGLLADTGTWKGDPVVVIAHKDFCDSNGIAGIIDANVLVMKRDSPDGTNFTLTTGTWACPGGSKNFVWNPNDISNTVGEDQVWSNGMDSDEVYEALSRLAR